jgi:dinuclear metal center YbgI/SA1388 family protein
LRTAEIFKIIEETAPLSLAETWDNPGLQLGSYTDEVSRIVTCLDLTDKVIKEAIASKAELILTHHPMFFEGLKRIDRDRYTGKMIQMLLQNSISVYAAHTNLDKAHGGLNDYVGNLLGLKELTPLLPEKKTAGYYKVVTFVPKTHLQNILSGIQSLDPPLLLGDYKDCTFRNEGIGTFTPLEKAQPFIGEHHRFTEVEEIKIETMVRRDQLEAALIAIKENHPYEEAVIDVFPLENRHLASTQGLGRIGKLKESMIYSQFISFLKERMGLQVIRECGPAPAKVRKVALCTGSGSSLMLASLKQGADLYITGDMKHHDAQRAYENGICVLDCGHYGTEKFASEVLSQILKKDKMFLEKGIEVISSHRNADFFNII